MELSPTDALTPAALAEIRALLDDAFAGAFSEEDWQHALGGTHALLREDGELIGHAAVVGRELWLRERVLWAGYVEAVAVRADRRGRGHGRALMEAIERVIAADYEIGALSATGRYVITIKAVSGTRRAQDAFTMRLVPIPRRHH